MKEEKLAAQQVVRDAVKVNDYLLRRDHDPVAVEVLITEGGVERRTTVYGYPISALAFVAGVSLQALRGWEERGVIPGPSFWGTTGERVYTVEHMETILGLLQAKGRIHLDRAVPRVRDVPVLARDVLFPDGTRQRLYLLRVGAMALALERNISTVSQMERSGVLPETPFKPTSKRHRLYTLDMIEAARAAIQRVGTLHSEANQRAFHEEVRAAWAKYDGVTVADSATIAL